MLRVVNPVRTCEELVLVAVVRNAVEQFAARLVRDGHVLEKRQRLGVEPGGRGEVAGKERAVVLPIHQRARFTARRRRERAEVPCQRGRALERTRRWSAATSA